MIKKRRLSLILTLFTIEDMYSLKIDELDGEMVLRLDRFTPEFPELYDKFRSRLQESKKLRCGEISDTLIKEEKKKSKSKKK